jgi:hypothetical protein
VFRNLFFTLLLLNFALGCSKAPQPVEVHGRVTFRGGPPPAVGTVYFTPSSMEGPAIARPAFAKFEQDGKFVATTRNPADGLFPGAYSVRIDCWSVPATPTTPPSGKSYVPKDYSPPELKIEEQASGPIQVEYDVP